MLAGKSVNKFRKKLVLAAITTFKIKKMEVISRFNESCWIIWSGCRSSHQRRSVRKVLKGLRPATLLKTLWRRCFLVNFAKLTRKPFLYNTSGGCFRGYVRKMMGWSYKKFMQVICILILIWSVWKGKVLRCKLEMSCNISNVEWIVNRTVTSNLPWFYA